MTDQKNHWATALDDYLAGPKMPGGPKDDAYWERWVRRLARTKRWALQVPKEDLARHYAILVGELLLQKQATVLYRRWLEQEEIRRGRAEGRLEGTLEQRAHIEQLLVDRIAESSVKAKFAADALHDRPGGSREMREKIRAIWATGKYSSRDICAEQECAHLGFSFSAARKALRNTPDPA